MSSGLDLVVRDPLQRFADIYNNGIFFGLDGSIFSVNFNLKTRIHKSGQDGDKSRVGMLGSGQPEIIFRHVFVLSLNSRFVVDWSQVREALLLEPRLEIVWAFTETNGEAADELESQGVKHAILLLKFVLDPLIVFQLKAVLIQHFLREPGILLVQCTALPLKI